jgi:hypothetical protein
LCFLNGCFAQNSGRRKGANFNVANDGSRPRADI